MGDLGLIPGLGRSPEEGKGYSFQYSDLENSIDYSPWGCKDSDTTEQLSLTQSQASVGMVLDTTWVFTFLPWELISKAASLIVQLVKNPPAMQETPVQFLGWEDPLEKG